MAAPMVIMRNRAWFLYVIPFFRQTIAYSKTKVEKGTFQILSGDVQCGKHAGCSGRCLSQAVALDFGRSSGGLPRTNSAADCIVFGVMPGVTKFTKSWYTTQGTREHLENKCWNCEKHTTGLFFCEHCNFIQPALTGQNYFEVLGVPVQFDIDEVELTQLFRRLQRHLHPDKFSNKSQAERTYSEEQSSLVNKAYQTLQKPLPRSIYLLEMHGATLEESEIQMDPEFLLEIMEINETLVELDNIGSVRELGDANRKELRILMDAASQAFKDGDIPRAKQIIAKLKYYANIDDKVKEIELRYAGKGSI